jgi:release factor glutamine methyltransferase
MWPVTTHPRQTTETWTTRQLLSWMTDHFKKRDIDSPRLCAEMLLSQVIGCERLRLYMEVDRPASPAERDRLRELVQRVGKSEPIQYVLGEAWFFGLRFRVTPDTLVPRPSTETLVEHILQQARETTEPPDEGVENTTPNRDDLLIADVGVGSGAISIALAKQMKSCTIVASDICENALAVARENAREHKVEDRIEFLTGSLLEPFAAHQSCGLFDFLVSNPPYISDREWEDVEANVQDYEPVTALRAGADGLDYLRPLIQQAHEILRPGGEIVFEIAASQGAAVMDLAGHNESLADARILKDLEGYDRVLVARKTQ